LRIGRLESAALMSPSSASGDVIPSMRPTKVSVTSLLGSAIGRPSWITSAPVRLPVQRVSSSGVMRGRLTVPSLVPVEPEWDPFVRLRDSASAV